MPRRSRPLETARLATAALLLLAPSRAPAETAFEALRSLPPEMVARVVGIRGREGQPEPERWYIQVHDPASPTGIREFAVSRGNVAANRTLSQFAERADPSAVLPLAAMKIDSREAADLLAAYASANALPIDRISYDLTRPAGDAPPAWTVAVSTESGERQASLQIDPASGNVIARSGLALEPPSATLAAARPKTPANATPRPRSKTTATPRRRPQTAERDRREPKKEESKVGRTMRRMGDSIQRFFGFED